jgi:glucose-6-phosphate dehydrogenase assembly protein OpcA
LLEGLRPDYLNNAVAALRLSSLPTLVWWRGGQTDDIQGLATLADRLVLDAEDPLEVWKVVENLAQRTSVSDLRWTRLTRWRALMAHFFDIPEVCAAACDFRTLRVEGSDRHAMRLFAGWLMSILGADQNVADLREQSGLAPIENHHAAAAATVLRWPRTDVRPDSKSQLHRIRTVSLEISGSLRSARNFDQRDLHSSAQSPHPGTCHERIEFRHRSMGRNLALNIESCRGLESRNGLDHRLHRQTSARSSRGPTNSSPVCPRRVADDDPAGKPSTRLSTS